MENASFRFFSVKSLIITAITVFGLGISLANAALPSDKDASQSNSANNYNWLAGGGG